MPRLRGRVMHIHYRGGSICEGRAVMAELEAVTNLHWTKNAFFAVLKTSNVLYSTAFAVLKIINVLSLDQSCQLIELYVQKLGVST